MEKSFGTSDSQITSYTEEIFRPLDKNLKLALELAKKEGLPDIQVCPMDGLHLETITRACQAIKAVEIGTLGGFSGVYIARGLSQGGKLYTFEKEDKHAAVAEKVFKINGVSEKVQIILGNAIDQLKKIEAEGPFDLAFLDADKVGYPAYLSWCEKNLRRGGVVLGDNCFGYGYIAADLKSIAREEDRKDVEALRVFNKELSQNGKWRATILPTGEGLSFAVKL
jgi:caffeoyl-CoA O-methyltransferase